MNSWYKSTDFISKDTMSPIAVKKILTSSLVLVDSKGHAEPSEEHLNQTHLKQNNRNFIK
jgi:hypothetical protein